MFGSRRKATCRAVAFMCPGARNCFNWCTCCMYIEKRTLSQSHYRQRLARCCGRPWCLIRRMPLMGRLISIACAWPKCCSTCRGCVGSSPMRIWSRCCAPLEMGLRGVSMIWCEAMPWAPGGRVNSAVVCMASQRGAVPPAVRK